jgi:ribonuclease BN (tRNA processing enzyme)
MAGLLESAENAYIFGAHTFIMELTYLDGDRSKAAEWGHIHLDDVISNAHLFESVQRLVFVHISQKYSIRFAVAATAKLSAVLLSVSIFLHSSVLALVAHWLAPPLCDSIFFSAA